MPNKNYPSWLSKELHLEKILTQPIISNLTKENENYLGNFEFFIKLNDYLPSSAKEIDVNVFCGSHGIEKYNISAVDTIHIKKQYEMGRNRKSIGGLIAERCGLNYKVWDCGIDKPTKDIFFLDAMTTDECNSALLLGWNAIKKSDAKVIALGELGACNTTSATALVACILNCEPSEVIGRGSGITDERLIEKTRIIKSIIERVRSDSLTSLDLLYKIGGREIAALTGAIFRATLDGKLIVLDGFVTCVAALIVKHTLGWTPLMCCPSKTAELGQLRVCAELDLNPLIDLRHTSGDGVGASIGSTMLLIASAHKKI